MQQLVMIDTGAREIPHGQGVPKPDAKPSAPQAPTLTRGDLENIVNAAVDRRIKADKSAGQGDKAADNAPVKEREIREVKPFDTSTAAGKSLNELAKKWFKEDVGKGWGQATLPIAIGAMTETGRWSSSTIKTMVNTLGAGPISGAAEVIGKGLGDVVGLGTQLAPHLKDFAATSQAAAIIIGVANPTIAAIKRIAMGDNAWSEAAKYWMKKDEGGIINRVVRGAEGWAMKKLFFHEDKQLKKLIRWESEGKDPAQLMGGASKKDLANLIASAATLKTGGYLLEQMGVEFSADEKIKLSQYERAFDYGMKIADSKMEDSAEKESFAIDVLPKAVKDKELKLWLKQTGLVTGIGMVKSATMIGLLQVLEAGVIEKAYAGAVKLAGATWDKAAVLGAGINAEIAKFQAWVATMTAGAGGAAANTTAPFGY